MDAAADTPMTTPADAAHAQVLHAYAGQIVMNALTSGHVLKALDLHLLASFVAGIIARRFAAVTDARPDSIEFAQCEATHLRMIGNVLLKQADDLVLRAAEPATETPQ